MRIKCLGIRPFWTAVNSFNGPVPLHMVKKLLVIDNLVDHEAILRKALMNNRNPTIFEDQSTQTTKIV